MGPSPIDPRDLNERVAALTARGRALEAEGLAFPTDQIAGAVRRALDLDDPEQALAALRKGEVLYAKVARDWSWVRELLRHVDELRGLAESVGMDMQVLDGRVGNARERLQKTLLTEGSLDEAAASASLSLTILRDAIPKFCIREAQKLGSSIRAARNRGEDVREATRAFEGLLTSVKDGSIPVVTRTLLDTRQAVARIPLAPVVAALPSDEEQEILLEARNLARRLQRIKSRARDAHSAVKLMTQVRAALSEDRRFGTPEEEIEELWNEVDRLTKERRAVLEEAPPDEGARAPLAPDPGPVGPLLEPPLVPPAIGEPADLSGSAGLSARRAPPRPRFGHP